MTERFRPRRLHYVNTILPLAWPQCMCVYKPGAYPQRIIPQQTQTYRVPAHRTTSSRKQPNDHFRPTLALSLTFTHSILTHTHSTHSTQQQASIFNIALKLHSPPPPHTHLISLISKVHPSIPPPTRPSVSESKSNMTYEERCVLKKKKEKEKKESRALKRSIKNSPHERKIEGKYGYKERRKKEKKINEKKINEKKKKKKNRIQRLNASPP
ncbi:hypothetical protein P167DRAFT_214667 [Morchella conica CCBAS932]|uniref:Uncharacterized protein n=1 Tax=Morchella conica CCBAS932 TaxID=1392247 RepID=A0A3N4KLM6_9PEZI|nr:hypothetical protein P167DRAFT_214667 [Morchella conica CCBAS932]